MDIPAPITAGRVTLEQTVAEEVTIRHRGKAGDMHITIDAAKLERWALRILREEAFSVESPRAAA